MPVWLSICLVASLVLGVGAAVLFAVVIARRQLTVRRVPTLRAGLEMFERQRSGGAPAPDVWIVVPAHNEREHLPTLIRSLRAQSYPGALRVVLALDRCTDDTQARAEEAIGGDARFTVLPITQCPPGIAGKVNAVCTAVEQSGLLKGEHVLLFTDADTEFHPDCVRAAVGLLRERELGLLSLLSTYPVRHWYELIGQPVAGTELLRLFPLDRANRTVDQRPFANGQFLMLTAQAYRHFGGHWAVTDALLEDIAMARRAAETGVRTGIFLADGLLICRMYETWAEFRKGWKRIFAEAAGRKPERLRAMSLRMRGSLALLPPVSLAGMGLALWAVLHGGWDTGGQALALATLILCGVGSLLWLIATGLILRTGRVPIWAAPLFPVGAWLVAGIIGEIARDLAKGTPTEWAGRSYVLKRPQG
ncbi:MAG: glycosyltransferase family 2 protein [Planctomycetota bacterium]|nr:glycosyltransferase family 2 protein [Planctomycetota bacterium]